MTHNEKNQQRAEARRQTSEQAELSQSNVDVLELAETK